MVSQKKLTEQLRLTSEKIHVLTDLEDRYVYSFEKIFMDQAYPLPDIVVKVYSADQKEKIIKLAEKEDVIFIRRGERPSSTSKNSSRTLLLLDDVKIASLDGTEKNVRKKSPAIATLSKLHQSGYGTYRNLTLAIQTLFSEKFENTCFQSSICSDYCTVTPSFDGIETWSARGRGLLIKGVMKGELPLSNKIVDVLYTCSKCGRCFGECFQNVDLHEAIVQMRRYIVENNMVPQVFQTTANNILEHGDPGAIPVDRRLAWMKNVSITKLPEKADYIYFVGCVVANRTPNTAKALFNILDKTDVNFTMLGKDEGCCGYALLASGLWDEAQQVANELIKKIEKSKAESLITPCAGCYYTFTRLYPEILEVNLPCETIHSTQFIEKRIRSGELDLKALKTDITYHDPCSLGRHSKVYDPPRNVLNAIPDLNLVEMPFNRDQARCCGGGGGLWTFNHQVSMESTHTRLKEDFLPNNVDILVTACPQCQMNFHLTSRRKSIPLQTKDVVEIVESVLITKK